MPVASVMFPLTTSVKPVFIVNVEVYPVKSILAHTEPALTVQALLNRLENVTASDDVGFPAGAQFNELFHNALVEPCHI